MTDVILRSDYQATPLHGLTIIPLTLLPFPPDKYGDYDPNTRIPQRCVLTACIVRVRLAFLCAGREGGREGGRARTEVGGGQ